MIEWLFFFFFFFFADCGERWIFFAQMLVSVDFPLELPVGDISHLIKGASERQRSREQFSA